MGIQATSSSLPAPALTPAPAVINTSNDSNVEALIAAMFGENSKLYKEAEPTEQQKILASIKKALADSENGSNFAANMAFWAQLKDSLPKDSPLLPYVTAQVNLFANNPALQKLQAQEGADLSTLEDALAKLQSVKDAAQDIQNQIDAVNAKISDVKNDLSHAPWYDLIRIFGDIGQLTGLGIELGGLYVALGTVQGIAENAVKLLYNPDGDQAVVDNDKASINTEEKLIVSQSQNLNLKKGNESSDVLNKAKEGNDRDQTLLGQTESIAKVLAEMTQSSKA